MNRNETSLLYSALCYEEGHGRRTQHILKVYSLAKLLGGQEHLEEEEQNILGAAAILHDIAIKSCKENYGGDASQNRQKQEAPRLVSRFLEEAGYPSEYLEPVLELVEHHHDYDRVPRTKLLQLLIEADLIINCYETCPEEGELEQIGKIFETMSGRELLRLCAEGLRAQNRPAL